MLIENTGSNAKNAAQNAGENQQKSDSENTARDARNGSRRYYYAVPKELPYLRVTKKIPFF